MGGSATTIGAIAGNAVGGIGGAFTGALGGSIVDRERALNEGREFDQRVTRAQQAQSSLLERVTDAQRVGNIEFRARDRIFERLRAGETGRIEDLELSVAEADALFGEFLGQTREGKETRAREVQEVKNRPGRRSFLSDITQFEAQGGEQPRSTR